MGVALGPFWLARRLAAGRTGEVWQGVHRRDSVQVAVKLLTLGPQSKDAREIFTREVGILAGLDHPNIVRIWDHGVVPDPVPEGLGVEAGSPYLVMEQGRATLGDRKDAMPWSSVRRVAIDLLTALAHAHAHRVLHRDIKPANVLLCPAARPGEKDRVVLTDFGFASPPGVETELVGLTPGFAAPEQLSFDARAEGPWTDLFALGCVLWRLLTGKSPFDTASIEVAQAMQARPLPKLDGVPPAVLAWLKTLLAVPRIERPPSAAHALRALRVAEGSPAADHATDWRAERPIHPGPRNLTGAGLGLVGIRSGSVGREAARDASWAAFRSAAVGRTTVFGLRGIEGIGKSHLARWLCEEAHERWGAEEWVVTGPTATDGLVAALRRRIGVDGLDARAARTRIGTWLDGTGGQGLFEARSVARILEPGQAPTPERWAALADLLRRACRRVPLVVRFEDAHGMFDLLGLVTWLAEQRPELSLLLLVTRTTPGWEHRARPVAPLPAPLKELSLEPLSPEVIDQLLGEHLGLSPGLQGELARAGAGNPGVANRLLRRCIDRSELAVDDDGRWHRTGEALALDDAELAPANAAVRRVLAGRPDTDRDLLELAATLGDVVDSSVLFAAERTEKLVIGRPTLQLLVEDGLWTTWSRGFAFVDARVAEVIRRQAKAQGRWVRWNELAAQLYARVPGGAAQIRRGEHLFEAGRVADAVGPWRRGLEARLDEQPASVTTASLVAWSRALAALRLPPDDERHASPEELSLALAWLGGDPIRAKRLATALATRAERRWPDTHSTALRFLALSKADALEPDGARGWAAASVAAAVRPEVKAMALLVQAEAELLGGDADAASVLLQRALSASSGFGLVESRVLFALARITVALGQRSEARALVQRAAATVERTGREADAWALREVLGRLSTSRGEHAVAVQHFEASMNAWRSAGQHELVRRVAVPSVRARLAAGDVPAAWAACRLAAHSALPAVRLGASAGMLATAAASGDLPAVERALAEVNTALAGKRLVLPDVGDLLTAAATSLATDAARAEKLRATAASVLGPLTPR